MENIFRKHNRLRYVHNYLFKLVQKLTLQLCLINLFPEICKIHCGTYMKFVRTGEIKFTAYHEVTLWHSVVQFINKINEGNAIIMWTCMQSRKYIIKYEYNNKIVTIFIHILFKTYILINLTRIYNLAILY